VTLADETVDEGAASLALPGDPARPAFAHASEAEMARILDFYAVRWAYEPDVFPILWSVDGEVVESFSPDFYLPDLDVYLEMTTLRQRLVRKKNRKLRRLRELYPAINIKLFYARDFRALMLKYGKLALVESLSGSSGQVVHERTVEPDPSTILVAPLAGAPGVLAQVLAQAPPRKADAPALRPPGRRRPRTAEARRLP